MRLKDLLTNVFVKHTGKDREIIERDTDRDIYLSAHQAVEYGLVDGVLEGAKVGANGR
jgi:ATP-dependent Clp protease, protease subunit